MIKPPPVVRIIFLAVVAAAFLFSTGCATKKFVREALDDQDRKIQDLQTSVETAQEDIEANEKRIDGAESGVDQAKKTGEKAMQVGQQAQGEATEAKKLARGKVLYEVTLTDENVKFAFDRADLSDEAKAALDAFATKVKGFDHAVYVEIEGHTDSTGTESYNYKLGLKRAETARYYLAGEGGLPLHILSAISFGETRPTNDNDSRESRARNRRVVLRILE